MDTKFFGKVTNGKLVLDNEPAYQSHLLTLEGEVELIARKRSKARSVRQNDYYWGVVLKCIADETGHSTDEIHELMKSMFLKDVIIVGNEPYITNKSTTRLTTKQFSTDYIERIKFWALDTINLNIPDPDEVYV